MSASFALGVFFAVAKTEPALDCGHPCVANPSNVCCYKLQDGVLEIKTGVEVIITEN